MTTILITGASGFIGSHLIKKLKTNEDIKLKLLSRTKKTLFNINLLQKSVVGCDVIVHLAGITNSNDEDLFKVNVLGTVNLLEVVKRNKPSCKIIFPSTFAVYRTPKKSEIITEEFNILPRNKYGLSKKICEELLEYYSHNFNIKSVVLRISNIYGLDAKPFKHSVIATFLEQITLDQPLTINGDGKATRDFIYIDDVISAICNAIFKKNIDSFSIFNICSGQQVSLNELVNILEKITSKKIIKVYNNLSLNEGYWCGDYKKAKKVLGWIPKVNIVDGLNSFYKN